MEAKVKFICCDMPEATELTLSFLAVIAAHESKMISDRVTAALAEAKRRGVKLGNAQNLTNRDTSRATAARVASAADRNAEVLTVINEMEAEHGAMSLRALAAKLNEAGYTTSRGKPFQAASVKRIKDTRAQHQPAEARLSA